MTHSKQNADRMEQMEEDNTGEICEGNKQWGGVRVRVAKERNQTHKKEKIRQTQD